MTTSGHSDLPGEQGNAYADDVTGSGQKTATGIDPRIETGLPENESAHVESVRRGMVRDNRGAERAREVRSD